MIFFHHVFVFMFWGVLQEDLPYLVPLHIRKLVDMFMFVDMFVDMFMFVDTFVDMYIC